MHKSSFWPRCHPSVLIGGPDKLHFCWATLESYAMVNSHCCDTIRMSFVMFVCDFSVAGSKSPARYPPLLLKCQRATIPGKMSESAIPAALRSTAQCSSTAAIGGALETHSASPRTEHLLSCPSLRDWWRAGIHPASPRTGHLPSCTNLTGPNPPAKRKKTRPSNRLRPSVDKMIGHAHL